MTNVISLRSFKVLKAEEEADLAYRAKILSMNKLELLEEMVAFQEERTRHGELTFEMMNKGKYLFKSLEEVADTQELKLLARSYRRHLEFELAAIRTKRREEQSLEAKT